MKETQRHVKMAMTDYIIRERLPELRRMIDNTHLSYLETDDSPDKLDQRKKLEGYIMEYLCLVPHESKFCLPETAEVLSRSAMADCDFSGYRLARGWAALARYAANLLAQPWRKEYRTIRLYSGFYKHEVEGSGMTGGGVMLRAMGYRGVDGSLSLDGPVCPDQVAAVSRDSLIAYVECQIMTQIWEEVAMHGGSCSWWEVARWREGGAGDVKQAVNALLHTNAPHKDIYSNVKFPETSISTVQKLNLHRRGQSTENHSGSRGRGDVRSTIVGDDRIDSGLPISNGHMAGPLPPHVYGVGRSIPPDCRRDQNSYYYSDGPPRATETYRPPPDMHLRQEYVQPATMPAYGAMPPFYYGPMPVHPYVAGPALLPYTVAEPLVNGYRPGPLRQTYYPAVPTGRLIELDQPSDAPPVRRHQPSGSERNAYIDSGETERPSHSKRRHDSDRRNGTAIKSPEGEQERRPARPSDIPTTVPRSDTQPSLSRAREDGTGTFESWDYVFRNLETQGYSKDLGERGDILSPRLESSTGAGDPGRRRRTAVDLEDGLHAIELEKKSDEEAYRTAKVNETLLRMKQETEAKAVRRRVLADEREKRKSGHRDGPLVNPVGDLNVDPDVSDRLRLISKEDARDKKEVDRGLRREAEIAVDPDRKIRKSIVKCLSSDADKTSRRKLSVDRMPQLSMVPKKNHTLPAHSNHVRRPSETEDVVERETAPAGKWECATCTFLNAGKKKACDMCGKSKRCGVEALPLTSGGKECPACTLVNRREANSCAACDTNLQNSPTYI